MSRKALDFRADTTERRPPLVTYQQKEIGINVQLTEAKKNRSWGTAIGVKSSTIIITHK